MVFTTHVEMMTRSSYLGEIYGVKISSVWTLPKQGDLVFTDEGGVGKEIKLTIFISLLPLKSGRYGT